MLKIVFLQKEHGALSGLHFDEAVLYQYQLCMRRVQLVGSVKMS